MHPITRILSLAVLTAGLLSCQSKEESLTDKEKIQGTWKMVSGERGGEPLPDVANYKLVIEGNTIQLLFGDGGFGGKLLLDHGREPKVMDMQLTAEGDLSETGPIAKGIYELEGDTLKWCNAAPGVEDRPTEFSSTKENNHMLAVLEKVTE